ncbi:MAG: endonuclease/exonuclease/phosphatase family protein [Bacteroidales bacterium]|nr:endonuclease/exonuclease/phosphatase family protein [Bacteroidales bacterium]
MRKVLCIIACLSAVCALSAQTRLKVMSYNIRFGSASEKKPEYEWKNRKAATPALIEDIAPDIMGLNEPEWDQHEFILRSCRDYAGYDIPRDPGSKEKESEPIYWNRKKIKPLKLGVFWMSETPDVPSRSWGARHYDLATWGIFKIKATGEKFFFMNIHLDSQSVEARRQGLKMAFERCSSLNPENLPVILSGDFNMRQNCDEVVEFDTMMSNSRLTAENVISDVPTFHGFGRFLGDYQYNPGKGGNRVTLDYIYHRGFSRCLSYETITRSYENVPYVSDHYPIVAELEF